MISLLEYLPVPTMSRDVKSLPPSTRFVSCISRPPIISPLGSRRDAAHLAPPPIISPLGSRRDAAHLAPPPIGRTISTLSPARSIVAPYSCLGVMSRLTATAVYSRLIPSCARRPSTLSPSATSMSLPFTTILINDKRPLPFWVRPPILRLTVFPSPALSGSGSRGPGPHPVLRNPPPTADSRSIRPLWRRRASSVRRAGRRQGSPGPAPARRACPARRTS